MADKTVTVKSVDGDYSSLNAAFSGEDGVAFDAYSGVLHIVCYNFADSIEANTGTGFSSESSTHYISIEAYDSHGGKLSTNSYRINHNLDNSNPSLWIEVDYTRISIQFTNTFLQTRYATHLLVLYSNYCIVKNCIFDSSGDTSTAGLDTHIILAASSATCYLINNVHDRFVASDSGTHKSVIRIEQATSTAYIYNCTICNVNNLDSANSWGIRNSGTCIVKNTLFYNCENDATGTISDTYCSTTNDNTKGLTAAGTGNRFSQTFTFIDSGNFDFHLDPDDAGALGYGLNLYNDATYPFQDDIDGQDRGGSGATWDIGADEYVITLAIEQEGFWFRNDDGSESTATGKGNKDANITLNSDTQARLRMLLNVTGDPASKNFQLEYRYKPSGGAFGSWTKINLLG